MGQATDRKPVRCYSIDGTLLYTFKSLGDAARFLNVPKQNISRAAHGRRATAYKHIWRYLEEDKL